MENKNRLCIGRLLSLIPVAILWLFVFTKPFNFDQDFENYYNRYEYVISVHNGFNDFNELFDLISFLSNHLNLGFYGVLFFYAGISFALKTYFIYKESRYYYVSLVVYFCFFYFLHEINQIRLALAISVFILFLSYSINRKRKLIVLFGVFLSSIVHASCLVFLLPLIINDSMSKYRLLPIFIVLASFLFGVYVHIMGLSFNLDLLPLDFYKNSKINIYNELMSDGQHNQLNIFNFTYVSLTLFVLFIEIVRLRLEKIPMSEFEWISYVSVILGVSFFYVFSFFPVVAFRISELLLFGLPFYIAYVIDFFKPKWFFFVLILLYCMIILYVNVFYNQLIKI